VKTEATKLRDIDFWGCRFEVVVLIWVYYTAQLI
jgi:hypothetical protein